MTKKLRITWTTREWNLIADRMVEQGDRDGVHLRERRR